MSADLGNLESASGGSAGNIEDNGEEHSGYYKEGQNWQQGSTISNSGDLCRV